MHLFYIEEEQLSGDEWQHLRAVRLRPGDFFYLTDGKGYKAKAELLQIDKKGEGSYRIVEAEQLPPPAYAIHLMVAPTKNHDRLEWLVEKATEIGVSSITPVICRYSERGKVRTDRLERLAIQAMKQSLKFYKPIIHETLEFTEAICRPPVGQRFIAHLQDEQTPLLLHSIRKGQSYEIFIGPEGDFSEDEIKLALENHSLAVSLGESRLRTETAGIAACLIVQIAQQL
jgi:16S rRNA (uracil1498-N3)-methyltransferase